MRRIRRATVVVTVAALVLSACGTDEGGDGSASGTSIAPVTAVASSDALWQVGSISGLERGALAGLVPVSELHQHGDLGLGTFEGLDGEMVVLDGVVHQVGVDGVARVAPDGLATAFAQVTPFEADVTLAVDAPTTCGALGGLVDEASPDQLAVVRITGTFSVLTTRSVPAQAAPYPTLAEVVPAQQVTFEHPDRGATLVGVRAGQDLASLAPPGLHLHGLTDDEAAGGHVLDCELTSGSIEIDRTTSLDLALPSTVEG